MVRKKTTGKKVVGGGKVLQSKLMDCERTFDSTPDIVMLVDGKSNILRANKAAQKFVGKPLNKIMGEKCYAVMHGMKRPYPGCPFVKAKKTKKRESMELHLPKKDLWLHVIVDPVFEKGRLVGAVHVMRDITARKKTEAALAEEKEFTDRVIQTTRAIIVGLDKNHRIRLFNRGAERVTGYKAKEVLGKDWFKLFFKKELLPEMNRVWKKAWGAEHHDHTNPIWVKNGEKKIISWNTSGVYGQKDESKDLLISIGQDITMRTELEEDLNITNDALRVKTQQMADKVKAFAKANDRLMAAEKALSESERKFRLITEGSKDVVFSLDLQGRVTYVSPSVKKVIGYNQKDVIGKHVFEFVGKEQLPYVMGLLPKLFKGKHVKNREFELIRKDGRKIVIETNTSTVKKDGKIVGVQGASRDVTERKKAEKEKGALERKYRGLFNSSTEPLFIMGVDGKLMDVNPALKRLVGYSKKELVGKNVSKLMSPSQTKLAMREIKKFLAKGDTTPSEIKIMTKKGETKSFLVGINYLGTDKTTLVGIARDITEQKKAEEQMRAFGEMAVDREVRMAEMKQEVNELLKEAGRKPRYKEVK